MSELLASHDTVESDISPEMGSTPVESDQAFSLTSPSTYEIERGEMVTILPQRPMIDEIEDEILTGATYRMLLEQFYGPDATEDQRRSLDRQLYRINQRLGETGQKVTRTRFENGDEYIGLSETIQIEPIILPHGQVIEPQKDIKGVQILRAIAEGISLSQIYKRFYEGEQPIRDDVIDFIKKTERKYLTDTNTRIQRTALENGDRWFEIKENTITEPNLPSYKRERAKEHPTENGVPPLFLLGLRKLANPDNSPEDIAFALDHYHSGNDARRFTRIALQTSLNYLAVRATYGDANEQEQKTWEHLQDEFDIDDPRELLVEAKAEVRELFPFPYEESQLPDAKELTPPSNEFTPTDAKALASLILKTDVVLPGAEQLIPQSVRTRSVQLADWLSDHGHEKPSAQSRREAIEKALDSFSGKITFGHDHIAQYSEGVINWLNTQKGFAVGLYLEQVKRDHGYIPQEGEIVARVQRVLSQDIPEEAYIRTLTDLKDREHAIDQARLIEQVKIAEAIKLLLADSQIPEEQAKAFFESTGLANELVTRQNSEPESQDEEEVLVAQTNNLNIANVHKDEVQNPLIEIAGREIDLVIQSLNLIDSSQTFESNQLFSTVGVRPHIEEKLLRLGVTKKLLKVGHHRVYSPVDLITMGAAYRLGNDLSPQVRDQLRSLSEKKYSLWLEKKRAEGNGK